MSESIHDKLKRVRPEKRGLIYDVQSEEASIKNELPFVVGVMGDFSGCPAKELVPFADRKFVEVDRDNFDDVVKRMNPVLNLRVEDTLRNDGSELAVQLEFQSLDDFGPAQVAQQVEPLRRLLETRDNLRYLLLMVDRSAELEELLNQLLENAVALRNPSAKFGDSSAGDRMSSSVEIMAELPVPRAQQEALDPDSSSLLDQAIAATRKNTDPARTRELIQCLWDEASRQGAAVSKDVTRTISSLVHAIDEALSRQLAVIMHAPEFQKLEGSWRGLAYLVFNSETSVILKIKLLDCTKRELLEDLESASDFEQTQMWKKLYDSEFGMYGGEPYGALIGDYEFTNQRDDIGILSKMSNIAARIFCPYITSPSPQLVGLNSWAELAKPRDIVTIFDDVKYAKWMSFRESEDSRFVVMTMPRALARMPYGQNTRPIEEFGFEEVPSGKDELAITVPHDHYCWMNAAYVLATRLTDSFSRYSFCAAITGVEGGGKVEGLPAHVFTSDDGDTDLKCPSEVGINRRENELAKAGFSPLCHYRKTDYAVFCGAQSVHKPKRFEDAIASENAATTARLPWVMVASRFAHYIMVMIRDKMGTFMEASDYQEYLQRWLMQYVVDPNSISSRECQIPDLTQAKVEVRPIPGRPGRYMADLHLLVTVPLGPAIWLRNEIYLPDSSVPD